MKQLIKPPKLSYGDTIGLVAPSYAMKPENAAAAIAKLEELGFTVKLSKHLYSEADGYAGSVSERAEDFNAMISDESVKMLLFGGGEVCCEILPHVDFANIRQHPKLICSYSDSTTILDAAASLSGIVTFYGASPRTFFDLSDYNRRSFESRLMSVSTGYEKSGAWKTICPGKCEGALTGGYLVNYAALMGSPYFSLASDEKYLLFLEDNLKFSSPAVVSKWLSHLEQHGVFECAAGLIFGHYSEDEQPLIDKILRRIGEKYGIPVVRCEDFGHGANNSIFPIGVKARLDTDNGGFELLESGVS